jgi:peptidoglycan hydrolase-like protein with peptidoglycan-binding domain
VVRKAFPLQLVLALALAFAAIGGIVAAGAALRDDSSTSTSATSTADDSGPKISTTTSSTLPPTTTTTLPAVTQPAVVVLPPAPLFGWGIGNRDPAILAYENRLWQLHIDPGPLDGVYDQKTAYAVEAVQKLYGLDRNGRLGWNEQTALQAFEYALPLHPAAEPNRAEIDVTKQVITVYENYQVELITTTSTASGAQYCYVTPKRAPTSRICEVATTPSGRWQFYLYRNGWDSGDLGALYNPYYFNQGRAIHGFDQVPVQAASHGCARIPMHVAEYFHNLVQNGEAVYVDGGQPEQILSRQTI